MTSSVTRGPRCSAPTGGHPWQTRRRGGGTTAFASHEPALVVTDLNLSRRWSGIDLLAWMWSSARLRGVPMLLMTGDTNPDGGRALLRAAGLDHVRSFGPSLSSGFNWWERLALLDGVGARRYPSTVAVWLIDTADFPFRPARTSVQRLLNWGRASAPRCPYSLCSLDMCRGSCSRPS